MRLWLLPVGAVLMSIPLLGARRRGNISASRAQHRSSSKHHCMPARSGWSLIACVETLWGQSLPYSPTSFPLFSNAVVSNSLFLQLPSALIRLEGPGKFSIPETFVQHRASVTITGPVLCSRGPGCRHMIQSGPLGSCF